jgi:hypothetical protein
MKQKNRIQSGMRFFRYSQPPYFCSPNGENFQNMKFQIPKFSHASCIKIGIWNLKIWNFLN